MHISAATVNDRIMRLPLLAPDRLTGRWRQARTDESQTPIAYLEACVTCWYRTVTLGYNSEAVLRLLRKRGWARTTFYRSVEIGAERIAGYLNNRGVAVR